MNFKNQNILLKKHKSDGKIEIPTEIPQSSIFSMKNNKILRNLRFQLGLAFPRSSSFFKFSSEMKNEKKTENLKTTQTLAEDFTYNSLMEKKIHIYKSNRKENKSKSALLKQRDSLTQKLLANLNKNFEKEKKYSNLLDFFTSRKKILTMYERTETLPVSIFHLKDFSHLRITEDYKINTPKLCLHPFGHKCKSILKEIKFKEFFDTLQKEGKTGEITLENFALVYECENDIIDKIKNFVYDEHTVIPYIILSSSRFARPQMSKTQVLFVIHDIFENFMENINYYKNILKKKENCYIILFNYPGQLFTISMENKLWNNEEIAKIIDNFILYLEKQKSINLQLDIIKMIGFGYGGNILSYFASSCEGAFQPLNSLMLLNTFIYLDKMLYEKITQLINIFNSNVKEELALSYFFQMTRTSGLNLESIKKKMVKNPLSNKSKTQLLEGCLNNVNCYLKIQKCESLIFVVHSLQNSFVSITHADILNKMSEELKNSDHFNEQQFAKNYSNPTQKRIIAYLDGGHHIIEVFLFEIISHLKIGKPRSFNKINFGVFESRIVS